MKAKTHHLHLQLGHDVFIELRILAEMNKMRGVKALTMTIIDDYLKRPFPLVSSRTMTGDELKAKAAQLIQAEQAGK